MMVSVKGERCAYFAGLAYFEEDLGDATREICIFLDVDVPLERVSGERGGFRGDAAGECRVEPVCVILLVCTCRGLFRIAIAVGTSVVSYLNLSRSEPKVEAGLWVVGSCWSISSSDRLEEGEDSFRRFFGGGVAAIDLLFRRSATVLDREAEKNPGIVP